MKTFKDLVKNKATNCPVILAKHKGKIHELNDIVTGEINEDEVEPITISDKIGFEAYSKSVTFLMIKSFYKIVGKENVDSLRVLFSLGDGLYVEAAGNFTLNQELLDAVKAKMDEIVEKDVPITKKTISKEDAIKLFNDYNMKSKAKLFKFRRVSKVTLYSMGHFDDYFYGDLASSTGILTTYDLAIYKDGFLLKLPNRENPLKIEESKPLDNIYESLKEATDWSIKLGVDTVGNLNETIVNKNIDDLILIQEALMEKKIGNIAETINANKNLKFVMISGPSSSGKTSFSLRLSIQLKTLGINALAIAVDDYFINRDKVVPGPDGKLDLESIDIVDIEQFNKDMTDLLDGKTVELPTYNFLTGKREYKGNYLTLAENDILVIEGIHCLNDKLSASLSAENKYKIYISALTPLNIDEHNRVPSSDLRLIRRMSRDSMSRGTDAKKTIDSWSSVRAGEKNNIFPYQGNTDIVFNSSLIYELLILKELAEPLLFSVEENTDEYIEAKRLLKFLDFFLAYNDKTVPVNSLLKEFIGGSYFNV